MSSDPQPLHARRLRVARYLVGIAAVPLLIGLMAPLASAQTDSSPDGPHRPQLTDAQKTCLSQQGVTPPAQGQKPTDAQRTAFQAAAKACGIPAPKDHPHRPMLTDAQKTCLSQHGVTPPAQGQKPTDAQRTAFRAAAQACGIPTPKAPASSSSS
jgi:hypothetical protein